MNYVKGLSCILLYMYTSIERQPLYKDLIVLTKEVISLDIIQCINVGFTEYTLIGVSAAVGALLILGIGAGCLTWYCKRLRESSSKSDKVSKCYHVLPTGQELLCRNRIFITIRCVNRMF